MDGDYQDEDNRLARILLLHHAITYHRIFLVKCHFLILFSILFLIGTPNIIRSLIDSLK